MTPCKIVQHSDQTRCELCMLSWDTNDACPPDCLLLGKRDYLSYIPKDVVHSADIVGRFFASQNAKDWVLRDLASRASLEAEQRKTTILEYWVGKWRVAAITGLIAFLLSTAANVYLLTLLRG